MHGIIDTTEVIAPLSSPCKICHINVENEEYTILTCSKCAGHVHPTCSQVYPKDYLNKGILIGDRYWNYTCDSCHSQGELIKRPTVMWVSLLELIMYHLLKTNSGSSDTYTYWKYNLKYVPVKFYDSKDEILPLLTAYWPFVMCKETPKQFASKFNGTLTANITRYFIRMYDKPSHWALRNPVIPISDPRIQNRIKNFSKELTTHITSLHKTCVYEAFTCCFADICPIVDFRYEEAELISLSNISPRTVDQNRLLRKLKVRKLKRENGVQLFDLDMEVSHFLQNTTRSPIEVETITHDGDPPIIKRQQPQPRVELSATHISRLQNSLKPANFNKPIIHQIKVQLAHMQLKQELTKQEQLEPQAIDFVAHSTEAIPQVNYFIKTHYAQHADVGSQTRNPANGVIAYLRDLMIGFAMVSDSGEIYYLKIIPAFFHSEIANFLISYLCQRQMQLGSLKFYGASHDPMIPYLEQNGFVIELEHTYGQNGKAVRMGLQRVSK